MARRRIIEMSWGCDSCGSKSIKGRHKICPNCGNPREGAELKGARIDRDNTVTDPKLLEKARAGADWHCEGCSAGNRGDADACKQCGLPRGGHNKATGGLPKFSGRPEPRPQPAPTPTLRQAAPRPRFTPQTPAATPSPRTPQRSSTSSAGNGGTRGGMAAVFAGGGGLTALYILLGAVAVCFLVWFLWYGSQSEWQPAKVSSLSWSRTITTEVWTDTTVAEWRSDASERREIRPVNGSGERAGMDMVRCWEDSRKTTRVQCGTEEECEPIYRRYTEEECKVNDLGNGFAEEVCVDVPKKEKVGEDCKDVPKYCEEPVVEDKCEYRTQRWASGRTVRASGNDHNVYWPDFTLRALERSSRSSSYRVSMAYGSGKSYAHLTSQGEFQTWSAGDRAEVDVTRWFGVKGVRRPTP